MRKDNSTISRDERPLGPTVPITEAAARLGICRTSVYEGIVREDIPGRKVNGRFCIPRPAFEQWISCGAKPLIDIEKMEWRFRRDMLKDYLDYLHSKLKDLETSYPDDTYSRLVDMTIERK